VTDIGGHANTYHQWYSSH